MASSSLSTVTPTTTHRKQNLIGVIGTTGVGKSQLAIDLALALPSFSTSSGSSSNLGFITKKAEILNHDSMQVYKGSNVFTNKATAEEMMGVEHHLMGFLDPGEEYYVGDFKRDAIKKIDELAEQDILPIAVGGTTYYLQNLILPNNLVSDVSINDRPPSPASTILRCPPPSTSPSTIYSPPPKTQKDIENFPTPLKESILSLPRELLELFYVHPNLPVTSTPDTFPPNFPLYLLPSSFRTPESFILGVYNLLHLLDPESAKRWHWRDVRKVRRSLEIVWMGQRWDEVIKAQKGEREKGEGSRYRSLIFWVWAEGEVLNKRLDDRVDKMVEKGLLEEIQELWKIAGSKETTNYAQGIYQAIGFKEFEPYFSSRSDPNSAIIDKEDPLFKSGLERMKISTRQYAKAQIKWIRIKLLPAIRELEDQEDVKVVLLDATDLSKWKENVLEPTTQILKDFLTYSPSTIDPLTLSPAALLHLSPPPSASSFSSTTTTQITYIPCKTCTPDLLKPYLVLETNWKEHLRSRAHRKMVLREQGEGGMYQGKGRKRGDGEGKVREKVKVKGKEEEMEQEEIGYPGEWTEF